MSEAIRITPQDLLSATSEDAQVPRKPSPTRMAIGGLRDRLKARKTRLGPSTPIRMATGPVPPNPEPDLEIKLSPDDTPRDTIDVARSDGDELPSSALLEKLYNRYQENTDGSGELGSGCVPNSIGVAMARATGEITPIDESSLARELAAGGAQAKSLGGNTYYALIQSGEIMARADVRDRIGARNLHVETSGPNNVSIDLSDRAGVEDALMHHGSVVFATGSGQHAAALIGIAREGTIVDGQRVDSTKYLMYNGLPNRPIPGLPPSQDGATLSFVSAEQFNALATPDQPNQDVLRGLVFLPSSEVVSPQ